MNEDLVKFYYDMDFSEKKIAEVLGYDLGLVTNCISRLIVDGRLSRRIKMGNDYMYEIKCKDCNTTFQWPTARKRYCPSCADIRAAESHEKTKHNLLMAKAAINWEPLFINYESEGMKLLKACVKKADELGMSYGQYMASIRG